MAIVPTGSPAWVRVVDFSDYGGNVDKQNHLSQGVIDPLTDVGAEGFSRMAADEAACARVAAFCTMTLLCNDSSPAAPTVEFVQMMTGMRTTSYEGDAAPTGFPSAARNGDGDITITFDSSYSDEYGVAGAFEIQNPDGSLVGDAGSAPAEKLTATTLRIRAYDATGTALPDARVRVELGSGT